MDGNAKLLGVFFIWALWLSFVGQNYGQEPASDTTLEDFISRVSKSKVRSLVIETQGRGGQPGSRTVESVGYFSKKQGVFVRIENEGSKSRDTEVRWIRNSDYVALIERMSNDSWVIKKIYPYTEDSYVEAIERGTPAQQFFGGPLIRRLESIKPAGSNDAAGSFSEYHYVDGSPFFSSDPKYGTVKVRFDSRSDNAKLEEVVYSDPGVDYSITFDYSGNDLFPVNRLVKGVADGSGEELTITSSISVGEENLFDQSECFLTHYGLPEPKFSRRGKNWFWWLAIATILLGMGVFLWRRDVRSQQ